MVRDRVWPTYNESDKASAAFALLEVARECSKLLAPMCPFFSEHVYQTCGLGKEESVHMCKWPKPYKKYANLQIEKEMKIVQEIIEAVNAARKENNVKIRWPVESVHIETEDETAKSAVITFEKVLKNMTNSKDVSMGKTDGYEKDFSKGKIYVSKNILKNEALLRELFREVQSQRKQSKLNVEDKIVLYLDNDSMQEFEKEIKDKVGAKNIVFGPVGNPTGHVRIEEEKISFKIEVLQKIYD